ncbi:MAG: DUF1800 domain-containing protein [Burkholderiaceae bacterium]
MVSTSDGRNSIARFLVSIPRSILLILHKGRTVVTTAAVSVVLVACGQSGTPTSGETGLDAQGNPTTQIKSSLPDVGTTRADATRLLQQATFGPAVTEVDRLVSTGVFKYLDEQFEQPVSRFTYTLAANTYRNQIHSTSRTDFCSQFSGLQHQFCWRDWFSHLPVQRDFFRQAVSNPDQLRQRLAFALSQIFVVSAREVHGSYGIARYQQLLRDHAFSNFRTILEKVTLSPVMGEYLNMVNNEGSDPNENYARELLQLFSIGTCLLEPDASLSGGQCEATYDNEMVRNYAYALTGWTYPVGGFNPWCQSGCKGWANPVWYQGEMLAVAGQHDTQERPLLSGVVAASGRTGQQGLQAVLDSIMAHPNVAPFVGRQLIQFLVTSNPSPAYIARVSAAFNQGSFQHADGQVGSGIKGDMKATIAAILLDQEARDPVAASGQNYGRLREPVMIITGVLRALNGRTDGVGLGEYGWARQMGQSPFYSPSVFNFYSPMQPLSGTDLVAPRFGIANANTSLARINFANALVYWWYRENHGSAPDQSVPGATGTRVQYDQFEQLITSPDDSLSGLSALNDLLVDGRLNPAELQIIMGAMNEWTPNEDSWLKNAGQMSHWRRERIRTAVYLIISSPQYQVQR